MAAQKPNMREFMEATGADTRTASELLYGVVGANRDTRDWSSIMSSSDPMSEAIQQTGQMYGGADATRDTLASERYPTVLPSDALSAPAIVSYTQDDRPYYGLVAGDGTLLRGGFGTLEQAQQQGRLFGITGDAVAGQYVAGRLQNKPETQQMAQTPVQTAQVQVPAIQAPLSTLAAPARTMQPLASESLYSVPQFTQPQALPPLSSMMQPPSMLFQQYLQPVNQGIASLV